MKIFSGKKCAAIAVIIALVIILGVVLGACTSYSSSAWVAEVIEQYYYTDVDITDADALTPDEIVAKYLDQYSV